MVLLEMRVTEESLMKGLLKSIGVAPLPGLKAEGKGMTPEPFHGKREDYKPIGAVAFGRGA